VIAAGAGKRFGASSSRAVPRPDAARARASGYGGGACQRSLGGWLLGRDADEVQAAVPMHGAKTGRRGPLAPLRGCQPSLRAGIEGAKDCEGVVRDAGRPRLSSPGAIARVVKRGGGADACVRQYEGVQGHPDAFHRELFERLRAIAGDQGASAVLRSVQ